MSAAVTLLVMSVRKPRAAQLATSAISARIRSGAVPAWAAAPNLFSRWSKGTFVTSILTPVFWFSYFAMSDWSVLVSSSFIVCQNVMVVVACVLAAAVATIETATRAKAATASASARNGMCFIPASSFVGDTEADARCGLPASSPGCKVFHGHETTAEEYGVVAVASSGKIRCVSA